LFADCRLLKGGSVHEQLKIGQLDEFDFMIEMPQLADKSVLSFTISKSTANIKYRWKTLSILNDLLPIDAKQLISQFDMLPVWYVVKKTCAQLLEELLRHYALPNWNVKKPYPRQGETQAAITIYLNWKNTFDVGIDFVFAIPA
ncbi:unnamed protein product, partial [Didymodactylos carnosus]